MGLSEFLRMYKHRYGPCTEDTKVEMLGEYLAGEAKRVYRSILSSWDCASSITFDEIESRMKNLMLDNSRTGMLLKQQRVHGLRMKDEESYLSFITFLETKVCEAYDDASFDIIDGVKIQVLLKNIRDPVLALQVEQALRDVPMGSPLFPKTKDLVIAYERTAKQARQWTGNAGSGSHHNNGKGSGRGKFHGNSSAQGKPEVKAPGTDCGAAASAGGSNGGAPPRSVPVCFKCHKPGHRMAECSGGGAPHLTGGNAVAAKLGSSGPLKCHECGELGHIRPRCPKLSRGNFARASGTTNSGSAPAAVEPLKPSDSDSFLSMRMSQTTEELLSGVVNIIGKLHLQDILRKSPERLRKAKCLTVHPPGINIKDASGKEMPFLGLVQLEIKANESDPAELRKFLVQEGPTNFDVVLGTTAILGGSRLCDNFVKSMRSWNGTVRPCDSKDASSNGYCMRVAVESNEWSEVTVARSCYVRPGSQKTVRLSCGLKDAKAFLVGEGVSFCDVDTNGQLCATVANEGQDTLCLMKGKKIAKCVNAENVSLEDVEQAVEAAGHAMLANLNGDAAKRAAEIYERARGFERAMEKIFEEDLGKTVFIYLDDILVATDTLEEHLEVVEKVLSKLREYNLRLKPKKCAFLKTETAFLGHVISSEGLKVDAEKIEKILAFPVPKNATDIRSFLGLANYYRQFVKNFTLLSKPIRDVLAGSQFHWTVEAQSAFEDLKRRMSSTPVLAQPDIEAAISGKRPFILYTDASKDGVGAVLHQVCPDGKEHPLAFASKSCSKAERNYAITDLEALALIYALGKFKYFLLGTHVIARTDHQPLVSLFKRRDLSGRAHRWALEIQEWNNLTIEYVTGRSNVVADALSRNVEVAAEDNTVETQIKSVVMSVQCDESWLVKLKDEPWLKEIFQKPKNEWNHLLQEQDLCIEDNKLYMLVTGRKVLVVPQSETKTTFDRFHNGVFGGHAGWYKTALLMEKYVYWPSLRNNVRRWVRKCFTCDRHNKQRKSVPPLKPIVSQRPYELVGIDVFSISQTSSGVQHVVTVIDHHSKFCAAYAVADKSAETIAKVFWEHWCLREGRMCSTLLSDKGGEFLNEIMQEIQKLTGVEQRFTVGHNPRENGVTERMNETLKGLLSKMSDGVSEWDQRLAYALFFYNSSPHSTTGESPFFLLHGADANFPVCGVPSTAVSPYTVDLDGYKMELARGMKALHEVTTLRIQKQAEAMKRYYDQANKVEKTSFEFYDRVFVFNPNVSVDRNSTKLGSPWEGPFRITALTDNSATVRFLGPQKLEKRVQMDYLRKIPHEVVEDEFYLYKPDKKVGRPKGAIKTAVEGARKGRAKKAVRFAN